MTTNNELAEQIEQLVRQHIEATRSAAAAAVQRVFAAVPPSGRSRPPAGASRRARKNVAPPRTTEEVVALGERFYAVLCRSPGETMTTLAPQVGATPRALQVAVARLKRARRIRAVGQRRLARYFPMTNPATTATA